MGLVIAHRNSQSQHLKYRYLRHKELVCSEGFL